MRSRRWSGSRDMSDVTSPTGRLASLDAFRGLTIAGMVLVNNPGSWSYLYAPLAHAEWHGWTPTDLIFPYFLFIVGVAMPFSFRRRLADGAGRFDLFAHVVRRSLVLIAIGLAMRAIPDFDFGEMRLYGVLQRIGLVYFAAAGLYLWVSARGLVFTTVGLLLGYWAVMMFVPVPGYGMGDLSPDGNLAAYLDRLLMDGRLWAGSRDPEGLLSTFPAVATCLLGIFCGEWLQFARRDRGLVLVMWAAGAAMVVLGLAWGLIFPINKNLWTSSYVVFTAGTALLLLGTIYLVLDFKRWRGAWSAPFTACGMNSIAIFVASGMTAKTMTRIRVGGTEGTSLYDWIFRNGFQSWAGDYNGSLAFALTQVTLWLAVAWWLHKRRVYIRI